MRMGLGKGGVLLVAAQHSEFVHQSMERGLLGADFQRAKINAQNLDLQPRKLHLETLTQCLGQMRFAHAGKSPQVGGSDTPRSACEVVKKRPQQLQAAY